MVVTKKNPTGHYVDYTPEQLVRHLEKQFAVGMTWANYGAWHIDHIKPLAKFNFLNQDGSENLAEMRASCALSNLQPLWLVDNMRKGVK
jgi:hypothetical protein